jgi:hypothetical protein
MEGSLDPGEPDCCIKTMLKGCSVSGVEKISMLEVRSITLIILCELIVDMESLSPEVF